VDLLHFKTGSSENEDIMQDLGMELVLQNVINCGQIWKLHEERTLEARIIAKRIGIHLWPGKTDTWIYEA
jgi:hypothetical protein